MVFFAGVSLGVLLTIGAALILAGDVNNLDEGDENHYN